MKTRILIRVLALPIAGAFSFACGAPDRTFVDPADDAGTPTDGAPAVDASVDSVMIVDRQEPLDRGADAAPVDASVPDQVTPPSDAPPDATSDTTRADTVTADVAITDTSPADGTIADAIATNDAQDGWTPVDAYADAWTDVLDCSTTAPPRISPSGTVNICPGTNVTLSSSAAVSYAWSNRATTQAIEVGTAGSYTVTTVDARGCRATSAPTVVNLHPMPPTPTIAPSGSTRFCSGGSVTLTASSAASYLWSTGATSQAIVVTGSGNYTVTTTDANGCPATSAPMTVTVVTPTSGTRSYAFSGAVDTFSVPECVTAIDVDAYGAQGGPNNHSGLGGKGGQLTVRLTVVPTSTLQIRVGGAGSLCTMSNAGGYNGGGVANCNGWNDTGAGVWYYSGSGGGATDVRVSPYGLDDRVLVVGGGGGSGFNCFSDQDSGGVGGGAIGGRFPATCSTSDAPGWGGTQTAGGLGGFMSSYGNAESGVYGLGGSGESKGGTSVARAGGGGGGGYYGGGGGCWMGGGGGSDYYRPTLATLLAQNPGVNAGHGVLIVRW